MEGDGYGLDGRMYHIDSLGDGGWVTKSGQADIGRQRVLGGRAVLACGGLLARAAAES